MLPVFLLPEIEVSEAGTGTAFELGACAPQLTLTLGITHILQQHGLELAILGSEDGINWIYPPLAAFAQKFYCGTYHLTLDLAAHPKVRYVLPRWKMSRWCHSTEDPSFGMYLTIEPKSVERAISA